MSEHPTTDNHDFPRPEPGTLEDEWGTVINEELTDTLEERVLIVDVAAERDNYAAYADAVFLASDTGQISLGDGDSWEFRGIVPNDSDVLDAIEGETIAPSAITDLWDGTNVTADVDNESVSTGDITTDYSTIVKDGESIDDAINRASSENIFHVMIPPGTYDPFEIDEDNMCVWGLRGYNGDEVIVSTDVDDAAITISAPSVTVYGLRVRGDNGTSVDIVDRRVRVEACHTVKPENTDDDAIRVGVDGIDTADEAEIVGNLLAGNDINTISDDGVIYGNIRVGTIADTGSGNEIGLNT